MKRHARWSTSVHVRTTVWWRSSVRTVNYHFSCFPRHHGPHVLCPHPPPHSSSNPTDGLDVAESSDATSIKTQIIGLLNAIQYLKGAQSKEGGRGEETSPNEAPHLGLGGCVCKQNNPPHRIRRSRSLKLSSACLFSLSSLPTSPNSSPDYPEHRHGHGRASLWRLKRGREKGGGGN